MWHWSNYNKQLTSHKYKQWMQWFFAADCVLCAIALISHYHWHIVSCGEIHICIFKWEIIPLTKSDYANDTLMSWFQLMRKPENESKIGRVLSLSDTYVIHTYAHMSTDTLTRRQNHKTTLVPSLLSRGQLPLATHLQKKWGQAPHNWHKPLG